jgi:hypothetical protein
MTLPSRTMTCPAASFRHLQRLTDQVGLVACAEGIVPRREHGYRVDDAARGLVLVCREPSPSEELITLARRYLYFLAQAQAPDGRFRNRLGHGRSWLDQAGTDDCWGRALWGLGTAAAQGPTPGIRAEAVERFNLSAQLSSEGPQAMAFAALGAAEMLDCRPDHAGALRLLDGAIAVIGQPAADPAWPWPASRLTYANAAVAEAVILAGQRLGRDPVLGDGLRMLDWLLTVETRRGHLSVVPAAGWGPGETRPGFDQQPTEVAALADACVRAAAVTGEKRWLSGVDLCVAWFLGDNDARIPMLDERTGGAADALGATSRSRNQGAEATLAMISVLQQGSRRSALLAGSDRAV